MPMIVTPGLAAARSAVRMTGRFPMTLPIACAAPQLLSVAAQPAARLDVVGPYVDAGHERH
jgi:hypothetical protein